MAGGIWEFEAVNEIPSKLEIFIFSRASISYSYIPNGKVKKFKNFVVFFGQKLIFKLNFISYKPEKYTSILLYSMLLKRKKYKSG